MPEAQEGIHLGAILRRGDLQDRAELHQGNHGAADPLILLHVQEAVHFRQPRQRAHQAEFQLARSDGDDLHHQGVAMPHDGVEFAHDAIVDVPHVEEAVRLGANVHEGTKVPHARHDAPQLLPLLELVKLLATLQGHEDLELGELGQLHAALGLVLLPDSSSDDVADLDVLPCVGDEHAILDLRLVQHAVLVRPDVDECAVGQHLRGLARDLLPCHEVVHGLAAHVLHGEPQEVRLGLQHAHPHLLSAPVQLAGVLHEGLAQLRKVHKARRLCAPKLDDQPVVCDLEDLAIELLALLVGR
mmetsp:Transcript_36177/g.81732  ORF Transcript_36177/g.81732 Transcript_36177/m.81732 type:complete len:300 (-) Transcript_36177:247-1146(-)